MSRKHGNHENRMAAQQMLPDIKLGATGPVVHSRYHSALVSEKLKLNSTLNAPRPMHSHASICAMRNTQLLEQTLTKTREELETSLTTGFSPGNGMPRPQSARVRGSIHKPRSNVTMSVDDSLFGKRGGRNLQSAGTARMPYQRARTAAQQQKPRKGRGSNSPSSEKVPIRRKQRNKRGSVDFDLDILEQGKEIDRVQATETSTDVSYYMNKDLAKVKRVAMKPHSPPPKPTLPSAPSRPKTGGMAKNNRVRQARVKDRNKQTSFTMSITADDGGDEHEINLGGRGSLHGREVTVDGAPSRLVDMESDDELNDYSLQAPSPKGSFMDLQNSIRRKEKESRSTSLEPNDDDEFDVEDNERQSILPDEGIIKVAKMKQKMARRRKSIVIRNPTVALAERRARASALETQFLDERKSGMVTLKPRLRDFVDIHLMKNKEEQQIEKEPENFGDKQKVLSTKLSQKPDFMTMVKYAVSKDAEREREEEEEATTNEGIVVDIRSRKAYDDGSAVRNGGVWSWGKGRNGQLGAGEAAEAQLALKNSILPRAQEQASAMFERAKEMEESNFPRCILSLTKEVVTQVACGSLHSLVKCTSGRVYAWGSNHEGQLGLGDNEDRYEPFCLNTLRTSPFFKSLCSSVTAHGCATALCTPNDTAFMCGKFVFPQEINEGGSVEMESLNLPVLLECLSYKQVSKIEIGAGHYGALSHTGDLYMWGENHYGQLGSDDNEDHATPQPVAGHFNAYREFFADVACGADHTVARGFDGHVYTWGCNSDGQLGLQTFEHAPLPLKIQHNQKLKGLGVLEIHAAAQYSIILTEEGSVYRTRKIADLSDEQRDSELVQQQAEFIRLESKCQILYTACHDDYTLGFNVNNKLCKWPVSGQSMEKAGPYAKKFNDDHVQGLACGRMHTLAIASLSVPRETAHSDVTEAIAYQQTRKGGLASASAGVERNEEVSRLMQQGIMVVKGSSAFRRSGVEMGLKSMRAKTKRRSISMGKR